MLVDGETNAQNDREAVIPETLLLPKSIGDSQPTDLRLPASSLHSAEKKSRVNRQNLWRREKYENNGWDEEHCLLFRKKRSY